MFWIWQQTKPSIIFHTIKPCIAVIRGEKFIPRCHNNKFWNIFQSISICIRIFQWGSRHLVAYFIAKGSKECNPELWYRPFYQEPGRRNILLDFRCNMDPEQNSMQPYSGTNYWKLIYFISGSDMVIKFQIRNSDYVYLKIFRILIKVSAVGIIALTLLSTAPIVQVVQPRFDRP